MEAEGYIGDLQNALEKMLPRLGFKKALEMNAEELKDKTERWDINEEQGGTEATAHVKGSFTLYEGRLTIGGIAIYFVPREVADAQGAGGTYDYDVKKIWEKIYAHGETETGKKVLIGYVG